MAGAPDPLLRPGLIGARLPRVEDARLLTGHGRYADDVRPRDAAHVAIRRSDHPHARIAAIDTAAAASAPGVIGVFVGEDLAAHARPLRATSRMAGYHATEMWPLARGVVRYVGEPVVAVLAEDRYAAEDALELIDIAYEPLPAAMHAPEAAEAEAPRLHDALPGNVLVARRFARGDIDAAFVGAHAVVEAAFRLHRKAPLAIEPRCAVAEWDHGRRALDLHVATNIPGVVRDALAECLDMPGNRLRVVAADVGGSFGGKGSVYQEELLVAALARMLRRPVKWTSDRLEDLASTSQAFDERIDAALAVEADGTIRGLRAEVLSDVGAYSIYPWTAALEPVQVVSFLPGPYRVPAYAAGVRAVATPKAPTGPYRGVGRPAAAFAMERLIDLAAARLGLDPAEMRRRNLVRAEEFPYRTGSGLIWDRSGFMETLEAALRDGGYASLRARQAEARAAGRWFGIGLASYVELTGIGSRISAAPGMPINTGMETASLRVDVTGAITAAFGVASHGQGLETTLAQVIAEELGARIDTIEVLHGDTSLVASSTGSYASRSAVIAGGAATLAAREVRAKLKRAASLLMEADEADLEVADGTVRVAGTDRVLTFRDIARAVYADMGRIPHDRREDLVSTQTYDPYLGTAASATHLAAVEVDPGTFAVRVLAYHVAEDCGRIINPLIVDGQVQGAVAQGIGAALLEEVTYDADGQIVTASLADYLAPTAPCVPPIGITHLELDLPDNVGGFRGMGEGGTIGAPAAIANALSDALSPLGIAVNELPATPERLFRLVRAAQRKDDGA